MTAKGRRVPRFPPRRHTETTRTVELPPPPEPTDANDTPTEETANK